MQYTNNFYSNKQFILHYIVVKLNAIITFKFAESSIFENYDVWLGMQPAEIPLHLSTVVFRGRHRVYSL